MSPRPQSRQRAAVSENRVHQHYRRARRAACMPGGRSSTCHAGCRVHHADDRVRHATSILTESLSLFRARTRAPRRARRPAAPVQEQLRESIPRPTHSAWPCSTASDASSRLLQTVGTRVHRRRLSGVRRGMARSSGEGALQCPDMPVQRARLVLSTRTTATQPLTFHEDLTAGS